MFDFEYARHLMVEKQLAARGITDRRVLDAMRTVPREAFVESRLRESAYEDSPLPIGEGQTISQPFIVARMIEAAALQPGDRVLDVGAGSGYAAAVMSRLAGRVFAIERHAGLVAAAQPRLEELGYDTIDLRQGDGSKGWPAGAPFDAVIVAAAAPAPPQALKEQLADGGRLVLPVDSGVRSQALLRITRDPEGGYTEEMLGQVLFVPLVGDQGWPDDNGSGRTGQDRK